MTEAEQLLRMLADLAKISDLEFHETESGWVVRLNGELMEVETQLGSEYLMLRAHLYTYSEEEELDVLRAVAQGNLQSSVGCVIGTMSSRREAFLFKREEMDGLDAQMLARLMARFGKMIGEWRTRLERREQVT